MRKLLLLTAIFQIILATNTDAFEIVYPKYQNVDINAQTTFFIGSESPDKELKINDEPVKIHTSGGFYHVVDLNTGENIFKITNGVENSTYIINSKKVQKPSPDIKTEYYQEPKIFKTKGRNVILRSTPFDEGLNRLQHYDDELLVKVIAEVNGFYKVQLARDDYAYIRKDQLKHCDCPETIPAKIINYEYQEDEKQIQFTLKLDKKVPYIVGETGIYEIIDKSYEPFINKIDLTVFDIEGLTENKFEYELSNTKSILGYKSYYTPDNTLVLILKKLPQINSQKPLKGFTITVDPGHGGSEFGAIGCLGDKEKDINLDIALKLKQLLLKNGAKVILTRVDDSEVSLDKRVKISQDNNSDFFISIHNNALPDSAAKSYSSGTSVYFFYPQSCIFAKTMHKALLQTLKTKDDKVRGQSFAVIRNTQSLSILIEAAYMINPEDNAKLVTPEFREKIAQAILIGLENYINEQNK